MKSRAISSRYVMMPVCIRIRNLQGTQNAKSEGSFFEFEGGTDASNGWRFSYPACNRHARVVGGAREAMADVRMKIWVLQVAIP